MELAILNWNVRGLNNPARTAVRKLVADSRCSIVCLQETKLAVINRSLTAEILGTAFCDNFIYKGADGTRGGILLACNQNFEIQAIASAPGGYSVTANVRDRSDNTSWSVTCVYGPQDDHEKTQFLQELRDIKTHVQDAWLICGDFNLIKSAAEKSNNNLNLRMMGQFRRAVDDLDLREFRLTGRRFTWASERANNTLTRIDRIMMTKEWEILFPSYQLNPVSTSVSDHCPMLLKKMDLKSFRGFRFETFWLKMEGFREVVANSWNKPVAATDAIRRMHTKLSRTAKALRKWNKERVAERRVQEAIANDVIFNLDLAQEERNLTDEERVLRQHLKARLLGFAAIDRMMWKQRSRLTGMRDGDANTKLFHLRANGRRRKNHIAFLSGPAGDTTNHEQKQEILLDHFTSLMGTPLETYRELNWDKMQLPRLDHHALDEAFSLEEIKEAVFACHAEKAPGPDGYIGAFYKSCWDIIKEDLLRALCQMHQLRGNCWHLVNTANLVLIPKKEGSSLPSDFRPISLMHSMAKILCKVLANRLAPHLKDLISSSQSAFIKKRCIQDNFLYVNNVIKEAHRKQQPLIFLKLDIAKAFDSIGWPYMLKVMKAFGFGQRWCDLVSLILASSTSRVLLNGIPGKPFWHMRGLRQGDPLSPMLFILAMEPLQRLLDMATQRGILSPPTTKAARIRVSFYADDAAVFVNPIKDEIKAIKDILHCFGEVSGLKVNINKCIAYPIRCEGIILEEVLEAFGGNIAALPCKYLGLPLSIRKLRRVEIQPLLDKASARLKPWKGKLITRPGRLLLVNSVITAMATYFFENIRCKCLG